MVTVGMVVYGLGKGIIDTKAEYCKYYEAEINI